MGPEQPEMASQESQRGKQGLGRVVATVQLG
jgi:hypothetical protein